MHHANTAQQVFGLDPRPNLNTGSQTNGETPPGTVKASLDMSVPGSATFDTVIEATTAGSEGNAISIATVADGSGIGSMTRVGNALTYHYESGVTTVANFETVVTALTGGDDIIGVKTAGTPTNVLADPDDTFSATNLAGGVSDLKRSFTVNGASGGHWSLHLLVTGTPTGTVKFDYSNLPYPDLADDNHWVNDSTKDVTLSGTASRTMTTGVDKVVEKVRVTVNITDGAASVCGWATEGER